MKNDIIDEIKDLRNSIKNHNKLYYIDNDPIISDQEYDTLVKKLDYMEDKYPEAISTIGVRDFNVGYDIKTSKIPKEMQSVPMLSLSNCYTIEELKSFLIKNEKILKKENIEYTNERIEYVLESKLDGLSIAIVYKKGKLHKALTRGDGILGENVTNNILNINSIPKYLNEKIDIEVRGEIILPLEEFNKINVIRSKEGLNLFSSPRNAASGTIRQLDVKKVSERNLKCMFYQVVGKDLDQIQTLSFIKNLGLEIPENYKVCKNELEIEDFIISFEKERKNLPYDTDGVVIKIDRRDFRCILGNTNKAPRWAIAYKYSASQATTKIKDVTFQVGRTGVITPVANLEPVNLSNAIISNATLNNLRDIESKDIRIGDYVFIERSGEVIPKIIKPIVDRRTGLEKKIEIIKKCPSCNFDLLKEKVHIRCINEACEAKIIKQIEFFSSRDCMNIIGLGESLVKKLFFDKKIYDIKDIYLLDETSFKNIPGFKSRSINNILKAIEDSKNVSFSKLLFSLGIENFGEYKSNLLVNKFKNIDRIFSATLKEIEEIDGLGSKTSKSLYNYLRYFKNIDRINFLKSIGFKFSSEDKSNFLNNKTFAVTGSLENYSRSEIKSIIQKSGGIFTNDSIKSLDYLILGKNPGSKLEKAKSNDTKILSESEFQELFKLY